MVRAHGITGGSGEKGRRSSASASFERPSRPAAEAAPVGELRRWAAVPVTHVGRVSLHPQWSPPRLPVTGAAMAPPTVFVCYCREDAKDCATLRIQLAPFVANGHLAPFVDVGITSGQLWDASVTTALATADVGLFLVSQAWLGSDFVRRIEVPALFERWAAGECTLHCVAVEAVTRNEAAVPRFPDGTPVPLHRLQWIVNEPLSNLPKPKRAQAWVTVAETVVRSAVARPWINTALPLLRGRSSAEVAEVARSVGLGGVPPASGVPTADLVVIGEAVVEQGLGDAFVAAMR